MANETGFACEDLYRILMDTSIDGIFIVDTDGRVVARNRRFLEMWGLPSGAAQARDPHQLALEAVLD